MAPTAGGTAWRCLRCGTFVHPGEQHGKVRHGRVHHGRVHHGTGPAAAAPLLESVVEVEQAALALDKAGSTPR